MSHMPIYAQAHSLALTGRAKPWEMGGWWWFLITGAEVRPEAGGLGFRAFSRVGPADGFVAFSSTGRHCSNVVATAGLLIVTE